MDKRELILNTMQELFKEGKAGIASVNDIAKRAGIAKGGLYYYFHSKEEVMDALVEREYENIIQNCQRVLDGSSLNATGKLALLLHTYTTSYVDPSLDEYLHMPQNAAIHQKSLAQILLSLSEIITSVIEQGVKEGSYQCEYPEEYAHILLSVFTFLMDPGIFDWTPMQKIRKMKALAVLLENGLSAEPGSFSFLYSE
ncbi:MAG: TetR/AcrR family transcriptional regulator [Clostridiales bacterium]|nr:TetR/AcrR family transcriptional regulator [Clostridiales bacterium]